MLGRMNELLRDQVGSVSRNGIYVNFIAHVVRRSPYCRVAAVLWVAPVSLCALPLLPLALWRARWRGERRAGNHWPGTVVVSAWAVVPPADRRRWLCGGDHRPCDRRRNAGCMDGCRVHEHTHVRQCERWGRCFRSPMSALACMPRCAHGTLAPTTGTTIRAGSAGGRGGRDKTRRSSALLHKICCMGLTPTFRIKSSI